MTRSKISLTMSAVSGTCGPVPGSGSGAAGSGSGTVSGACGQESVSAVASILEERCLSPARTMFALLGKSRTMLIRKKRYEEKGLIPDVSLG
eukprot:COSAG02_NODE_2869_length_7863_cov_5.126610_2_plen_92_part_00